MWDRGPSWRGLPGRDHPRSQICQAFFAAAFLAGAFLASTAGTVKDVAVVAEECSDQIFQRPSIEAARRFKYKPRVIDGEAVEVIGVYNNFLYENEPEGRGEGSR